MAHIKQNYKIEEIIFYVIKNDVKKEICIKYLAIVSSNVYHFDQQCS